MSAGALEGMRIVELGEMVSAPYCAKLFADFGADVIKVEPPTGDGARTLGWRDPRDDTALYWKQVGRNKRTVVLDLKSPADLETMRALACGLATRATCFMPGRRISAT